MRWLRLLGQDWIRAPISGAIVILAPIAALTSIWRGDFQMALICLIYGRLTVMERGSFKEDDNE